MRRPQCFTYKGPLRHRLLLVVAMSTVVAVSVWGYSFEPIVTTFAPSGPGATKTFRVTSTENHKIALKITMLTRSVTPQGREVNHSAASQFIVFPSRVLLMPHSSQSIRVRYDGPTDISREQSYRIEVQELPVNFSSHEANGNSINLLFRYLGSVYVAPSGAHPNVMVTSAEWGTEGSQSGLRLTIENSGSAHTILKEPSISVTGQLPSNLGGQEVTKRLSSSELKGIGGLNLLAGETRDFFIPITGSFPRQHLHASLSFKPGR